MRLQFRHQRRPRLAVLWKLAGGQKNAGGTVAQHEVVVYRGASKLRHGYRVRFRRRWLAVAQQLASVLAGFAGAAEELAEASVAQLHFRAAFVAFQAWPFVALEPELAFFHLEAGAIRIVSADVQFALRIHQKAIHRGAAGFALALRSQQLGFAFFVLIGIHRFVASGEIQRVRAALLRRQRIARTAQKNAASGCSYVHGAAALGAGDVRFRRRVGAHALFALGIGELVGKVRIEGVQQAAPCLLAVGDLIQVSFHVGGKGVVQQFRKVLHQTVRDQLANALGVKTAFLQGDVATVLNGGNDRHVGGRAADAALLQLAHQAGFAVAGRRLGEMLHGVGLGQLQRLANREIRQWLVVVPPGKHPGIAVELQNAAAHAQFKLAGGNRDGGGKVLGAGHLRGHELSPDQVVEPSRVGLQTGELVDAHQIRGTDGLVRFLGAVLAGVDVGRTRQIGCAVGFGDVLAHLRQRFGGDVGGVRAHVGDVAAFVQALR